MRKFAIFIDGENFLLSIEGEEKRLGFFVTKRVFAEDEEQAVDMAYQSIRNDPKLFSAYKQSHISKPTLSVKLIQEITEVGSMEDSGYTFYPMDD